MKSKMRWQKYLWKAFYGFHVLYVIWTFSQFSWTNCLILKTKKSNWTWLRVGRWKAWVAEENACTRCSVYLLSFLCKTVSLLWFLGRWLLIVCMKEVSVQYTPRAWFSKTPLLLFFPLNCTYLQSFWRGCRRLRIILCLLLYIWVGNEGGFFATWDSPCRGVWALYSALTAALAFLSSLCSAGS